MNLRHQYANTRDWPPGTTETLDGLQVAINRILDGAALSLSGSR